MIYVAMSGAKQAMLAQSAAANNLANATTTGFRADLAQFRSMPMFGPGQPSRAFALVERPGVDLTPGTLEATGNELDVAVDGDGYFAVQAADGSEAYTRAGKLQIDAFGRLLTSSGEQVLGNGGPIALPQAEKIEFGKDGTISLRPVGQDATALVTADRLRLVRPAPGALVKGEDGLLRTRDGTPAVPDASVRVAQGYLETSNVSAVASMVALITQARAFELHVQAMKTAEENANAATQLLRIT